jgi:hypothetical protein
MQAGVIILPSEAKSRRTTVLVEGNQRMPIAHPRDRCGPVDGSLSETVKLNVELNGFSVRH